MWKPIRLFSFLVVLAFAFSQQITREFDINVELTGKIHEEKPRLSPPSTLSQPRARELNLSSSVLEPPKTMEFVQVKPIEKEGGVSCGEPKDALSYRLGVDYYLKGRYELAEQELQKVATTPNSPFKPMAEYVLGIIAHSKGEREKAKNLFRESCRFSHMYQKASCEVYYALHFMLRGSVPENQDGLWKAVKDIKEGREGIPACEGVVFSRYCAYVRDFSQGKENPDYRDSTLLRSGILFYLKGDLQRAKQVFTQYSQPGRTYRDVALYYLSLIDYKEGRGEQALRNASILETINPSLASELYAYISERDVYLSRLAYTLTKDRRFLERAGILSYNSGDYALALRNFLEAGNLRYAVYSAIKMGNYKKVVELLRDKREKDKEDYLWLLESLYWSGEDMSKALSETARLYPDLHREYNGWDRFRKGDWLGALGFFEDPYHKALALYNLKRYKEVISLLQGRNDLSSNLLKARSALMMGEPSLARGFLTERSAEELYLLGLSYFLEGNYARAATFFERVPSDSPLKAKAILRSGDSYYNAGDINRAKEKYYEVLRRFPDRDEAKQATATLLDFGGKALSEEELEKLLKDYIAKEPNPLPDALYQYADLQIKKGNKGEAERTLLRLMDTPLKFKAILKLAQIEEDKSKKMVMLYKVYKEAELEEDRRKARDELVQIYTSLGDTKSVAGLLAEGSNQDKVKAISLFMSSGDKRSALSLANQLINSGYRDQEFERQLIDLYRQTGDPLLLDYLSKSPDRSLRGQAIYLQGLELLRKGDRKKALERMVEISLNYRGEPYYNAAVIEGAKILLQLGARRDASCMLDRFDYNIANQEEIKAQGKLRQGLPKCEVR